MKRIQLFVLSCVLGCSTAYSMEVTLIARRLTPTLVTPICQVQYLVSDTKEEITETGGSRFISPIVLPCDLYTKSGTLNDAYLSNRHFVQESALHCLPELLPVINQPLNTAISQTYPHCNIGGAPDISLLGQGTSISLPQLIHDVTLIGELADAPQTIYQPVDLIAALYSHLNQGKRTKLSFRSNQPIYLPFYAATLPMEVKKVEFTDEQNRLLTFEINLLSHATNICGQASRKKIRVVIKFIQINGGIELYYIGIPTANIDFISTTDHCPGEQQDEICNYSGNHKPPPPPPSSPLMADTPGSDLVRDIILNKVHHGLMLKLGHGEISHGGFGP